MKANTREVCLVTHADPRCLASCTAVTTTVRAHTNAKFVCVYVCECIFLSQIALILQGAYDPCKKVELNRLVTEAIEVSGTVRGRIV